MQYSEEQLKALPKIYEKIKDIDFAMLTTLDSNSGMLHSRPMSTQETDPDGTLWFITYGNSEKAYEIGKQSNVNLSYSKPSGNVFVSVSGSAEIVEDKELLKKFWKPAFKLWFPEGLETPNIALLKVKIYEAEYWDSSENRMVALFKMVKAFVTRNPADAGEHEKVDLRKSY